MDCFCRNLRFCLYLTAISTQIYNFRFGGVVKVLNAPLGLGYSTGATSISLPTEMLVGRDAASLAPMVGGAAFV
jgi:hypothetical protein